MKPKVASVASHPVKPVMIYDGDCGFCKFWIERWRRATRDRVEYLASQDPRVGAQFPELPREWFDTSVLFIELDGRVYSGAEAVLRALTYSRLFCWIIGLYRHVPGFAPASEWAYRLVAEHRQAFSLLTRIMFARDATVQNSALVSWIFLRLLGLIYLIAFVSLATQIVGLAGSNGILPASGLMDGVRTQLDQAHIGIGRYHLLPTLCWFGTSDLFLRSLCWGGGVLSLLLIANVAPAACLLLLWLAYLSLVSVGGVFLGFQWDALLLETGFLSIFLAPPQLFPQFRTASPPPRIGLWLLRWLLFRLMFESGVVKLASGDTTWRDLTALNFHYETQPLPTWIGWYAHQLPAGCQQVCVAVMFAIELAVPFLIFAPRRPRFAACALLVLLQVLILLTGNYCFFNLLTLALCLLLLDDAGIVWLVPIKWRKHLRLPPAPAVGEEHASLGGSTGIKEPALPKEIIEPVPKEIPAQRSRGWPLWLLTPLAAVILLVSVPQVLGRLGLLRAWPAPLAELHEWLAPFQSVNSYGLFAVMTRPRLEIIVEGSNDGRTWLPYEFKYKPGDLTRRPAFVAPHQPRLDWQMWFAALGSYQQNPWFVQFCLRLLQGSPPVLSLLEHNPFPNAPPRYLRARLYEYHFTNLQERRVQGAWWRRELKGEYLPSISLRRE